MQAMIAAVFSKLRHLPAELAETQYPSTLSFMDDLSSSGTPVLGDEVRMSVPDFAGGSIGVVTPAEGEEGNAVIESVGKGRDFLEVEGGSVRPSSRAESEIDEGKLLRPRGQDLADSCCWIQVKSYPLESRRSRSCSESSSRFSIPTISNTPIRCD